MNWDRVEGNWEQIKGQVVERWGKLTNDDLTIIKGKKDQLLGKLQERYGYTKEQATGEVSDFIRSCDMSTESESKVSSQRGA